MKTKSFITAILALGFALPSFAATTTLKGVLTDNMCTKKHMMPGKPNADCVRDCIKHGAKYVVVSDGRVFELNGDQTKFDALAGKKVAVTGENKGNTFIVRSIESAQ